MKDSLLTQAKEEKSSNTTSLVGSCPGVRMATLMWCKTQSRSAALPYWYGHTSSSAIISWQQLPNLSIEKHGLGARVLIHTAKMGVSKCLSPSDTEKAWQTEQGRLHLAEKTRLTFFPRLMHTFLQSILFSNFQHVFCLKSNQIKLYWKFYKTKILPNQKCPAMLKDIQVKGWWEIEKITNCCFWLRTSLCEV